ncbi:MAG: hypothetical protein NZM09_10435 [Ignavibacterium sp.]|nr:hypothetical protein [Ignavibacterium sp.]MCX7611054.1 hypothetical protein [Ignavibacterium sp.]MDW8376094.1 hypothetical protein [Ignavibacteriales bacterium]
MNEISKYEILLNDLTQIESEIAILVDKLKVIQDSLQEKEMQIAMLRQENHNLQKKISELEYEVNNLRINSQFDQSAKISEYDNDEIKQKIKYIISKIDYHLGSFM